MNTKIVLVTGGNGFLGQHVIKHLQIYTEGINEIRVLDLLPFTKKLDYVSRIPVTSVTGCITDKWVVNEACHGVDIVFHLASKVDVRLFPDTTSLYNVNVLGTENIVSVCKEKNVEYLIYCGSLGSFYGYTAVENGTETSLQLPEICSHGEYGESKRKALEIVLKENGSKLSNSNIFRTVAILPPGMFGELDPNNLMRSKGRFVRNGIYYRIMGSLEAKIQYSYVGNVAYMFVKAYQAIKKNPEIGGQYFFATDDSLAQSHIEFRKPYLGEEVTPSRWYIPSWVFCTILNMIYCLLLIVRLWKKVNFPFSTDIVHFVNNTFYVSNDKAKTLLRYKPLYDYKTSVDRTIKYIKNTG